MTNHQSQINAIKARIEQFKTSDLFTEEQKAKRIAEAERELEALTDYKDFPSD